MQNSDITSIASLADASLSLVTNAPSQSQQDFESAVAQWVNKTDSTVQGVGKSDQVSDLMESFSMNTAVASFLLYALLPSIDSRYSQYFATLNDNKAQNTPSADLLTSLVSTSYTAKDKLKSDLEDEPPLFYWRLLLREGANGFSGQKISPGKSLVLHFAEDKILDSDPKGLVTHISSLELDLPFDQVTLAPDANAITINGGFSARRLSYAFKLAVSLQRPLFRLNTDLLGASGNPTEDLKDLLSFIILSKGILYWPDGALQLKNNPEYVPIMSRWFGIKGTTLIIGEDSFQELPVSLLKVPSETIQLTIPDRKQDELIWQTVGTSILGVTNIDYESLNNRYYTNYNRIKETFLREKQVSQPQVPETPAIRESYIQTSPRALAGIAHLALNNFSFDDMILTAKVKAEIKAVIKAYLNRILLDPSKPTGVITIFEGAIGTGKSMAAESIGNEIGIPVYRIDYSSLLNKVDKEETTLKKLFSEAEKNSACLLFDDADNLFARRSGTPVSSSDMLTTSLISHIESYGGLIVLTSSKKPKIDKSVFHRSMIVVDFPPMSPSQQFSLFQHILSTMGVKVDSKVDLKQLVTVLGANGQQIKNIINNAILAAAPEKVPLEDIVIAAKDLAKAIQQEKKKQPNA